MIHDDNDEDITRTAVTAYEKQRQHYPHQQSRPKPFIDDACFLSPSDLEFLNVILIYSMKHLDRLCSVKFPDPTTDNPFLMLRK